MRQIASGVAPGPKLDFLARFPVDLMAPIRELGRTSDLGKRRIIPTCAST